jgi:hypothetical protein
MKTIAQRLANSLEILKSVQEKRNGVIISSDIPRYHRERLINNGFLQEVIRGWLIVTDPSEPAGSSVPWISSYWDFIQHYLRERYNDDYCLSAESSLKIHTESTTIPSQLIVITKKGGAQVVNLPYDTSITIYPDKINFPVNREQKNNIWVMTVPEMLYRLQTPTFLNEPADVQIALLLQKNSAEILRILLERESPFIAGKLIGAYEHINENRIAEGIMNGMKSAGFVIRKSNPFKRSSLSLSRNQIGSSPHSTRIELLWNEMQEKVADIMPSPLEMPTNIDKYIKEIESAYIEDAYHSLSIEGYQVTKELIERVKRGRWNPERSKEDSENKAAMACKGYELAFTSAKDSIRRILMGSDPVEIIYNEHHKWYMDLFSPFVKAGLINSADLAGYRNRPVYIKHSRHVPPRWEGLTDCMERLFALLKNESNAGVRAVLGHFVFVYIHPYIDGNGRIGRFIMNTFLASSGYPWTIIRVFQRESYVKSLEEASVNRNIIPFVNFIKSEMSASSNK